MTWQCWEEKSWIFNFTYAEMKSFTSQFLHMKTSKEILFILGTFNIAFDWKYFHFFSKRFLWLYWFHIRFDALTALHFLSYDKKINKKKHQNVVHRSEKYEIWTKWQHYDENTENWPYLFHFFPIESDVRYWPLWEFIKFYHQKFNWKDDV